MENGLRHASGPVHANIQSVTYTIPIVHPQSGEGGGTNFENERGNFSPTRI